MIQTLRALKGGCVAPHHLAAQAGRDVLRDGGDAIEAMVAMAASIAVVYPHMNGLGGDGFWLIRHPSGALQTVAACGPAASAADVDWYQARGCAEIPQRGAAAALTVAGTVQGWQKALSLRSSAHQMPLSRLLAPAIQFARDGVAVTHSQAQLTQSKLAELQSVPGFSEVYLTGGQAPDEGSILRQAQLAATLEQLARAGLDDFYRGEVADSIAADLAQAGSPVSAHDLANYEAEIDVPLALKVKYGTLYNLKPPTQGLSSLMILGLFDRLNVAQAESFEFIHGLVEATKQAFLVRDRVCLDPKWTHLDAESFLDARELDRLAQRIDPQQAMRWPQQSASGDTVWMGCVDSSGLMVSFIQSIYWEFGSGLVLPRSGLLWQNRGISFSLDQQHPNALQPGRKPFHTLNPAFAELADGRLMAYGTMGGEGQPQTQAAIMTRYAQFGQPLQQAISQPRWLLGRTWGDTSTRLKVENRFSPELLQDLQQAGHDLEVLSADYSELMGHAGALVLTPNGVIEGGVDPRSDGAVAML